MKKVLYSIEVPSGNYCWQHPGETCPNFNNDGGHSNCLVGFYPVIDVADGVLKAPYCAELREERK